MYRKFAALLLSVSLLLTACNNGGTRSDNEIALGGDVIFSHVCEDEYSARIALFDLTHLPDGEENCYRSSGGGIFLYGPKGSRSGSPLVFDGASAGSMGCTLWADCAENALQIYKIEWNGENKYILRMYNHYGTENGTYKFDDPGLYCASFYLLNDMDTGENLLCPINKKSSTGTELYISDSLIHRDGNVLYDEKQNIELVFDPDKHSVDIVQ